MEPSLKAILEGYRGDIEVIAQALKAEVLISLHWLNLLGISRKCKGEIAIDLEGLLGISVDINVRFSLNHYYIPPCSLGNLIR